MKDFVDKPLCILFCFLLLWTAVASSGLIDAAGSDQKQTTADDGPIATAQSHGWDKRDAISKNGLSLGDIVLGELFDGLNSVEKEGLIKAMTRGFPVSANALGDMNEDGFVNIWDLLRIRNICFGIGDPPTSYESVEGDLNLDGLIGLDDILLNRDALMFMVGLPHIVDETGGQVSWEGITVDIPAGFLDSAGRASVQAYSQSEFEDRFDVHFDDLSNDSVYFMKALELKMPGHFQEQALNLKIELDNIPPCSLKGYNALFTAIDDINGDGLSELAFASELHPNQDSTSLLTDSMPLLSISSIELLGSSGSKEIVEAMPGQIITVYGEGFAEGYPDHYEVIFRSTSVDTGVSIPPYEVQDNMANVEVPYLAPGECIVQMRNIINGRRSDFQQINILALPEAPQGNADSILQAFFDDLRTSIDSIGIIVSSLSAIGYNPEAIQATLYYGQLLNDKLDNIESLIDDPEFDELIPQIAAFLEIHYNSNSTLLTLKNSNSNSFKAACEDLKRAGNICISLGLVLLAIGALIVFVSPASWVLAVVVGLFGALLIGGGFYLRKQSESDKCQPSGGPPGGDPSGGFGGGGFSGGVDEDGNKYTDGCCINIFKYGENINGHAIPGSGTAKSRDLKGYARNDSDDVCRWFNEYSAYDWRSPLAGAIVKVENHPMRGNVVGFVNNAGNFIIPQVPLNSQVILSMYHPCSGLYDENVATFTTGSTPSAWNTVLAVFNPDTTSFMFPISLGDQIVDTISGTTPRMEYVLNIGAYLIGNHADLAFWCPEGPLTLWVQDPDGQFIYRDSSAACIFLNDITFDKSGRYIITVTYGVSGGEGPFALGITNESCLPLQHLCQNIFVEADTLFPGCYPYIVVENLNIASGDTIYVEPGVNIQFEESMSITATGLLNGTATETEPIILKSAENSPEAPMYSKKNVDNSHLGATEEE